MSPWKSNSELSFVLLSATFHCQQFTAYLSIHTKCLCICFIIKEIRLSCTHFHESLHYQISRNSAQWETIWYIRTDRKTDGRKDTFNSCFSWVCEPACRRPRFLINNVHSFKLTQLVFRHWFTRNPPTAFLEITHTRYTLTLWIS